MNKTKPAEGEYGNLKISRELHRSLKIKALQLDKTLQELVEELLVSGLEEVK